MLPYTAISDYLLTQLLLISSIFSIVMQWSRYTVVRPLPPQKQLHLQVRVIIKHVRLNSNYYIAYFVYAWGLLAGIFLLLLIQHIEILYTSIHMCLTEYLWLYLQLIWWVLLTSWIIYSVRAALERVNSDALLALIIIVGCIQLYYVLTNIWSLTILLEGQGIALMLLLNTDQIFAKNTLYTTTAALKQQLNTPVANALIMQFWVGFTGAALLLLAGGLYIAQTGITHWQDMSHLGVLDQVIITRHKWLAGIVILLLVSLCLKTGAFPMHFWKPDLYNNLRFTNVFIYAVPYSVAVTLVVIFLLNILYLITPQTVKWILSIVILIATYVLFSLLLAVTEIKAFLAYTSGLHAIYVYAATITDRIITSAAIFYNMIYWLSVLTMFTALLSFRRTSIKYLTDLQIYAQMPTKVFWISTAIATMAGIPPLLGFWAKFNVLYSLWATAELLLTVHLLIISMTYMYFYIALYRFTGATNFKVKAARTLLLASTSVATIGISTAVVHWTGVWHVMDISSWSTHFAQHLYDYA